MNKLTNNLSSSEMQEWMKSQNQESFGHQPACRLYSLMSSVILQKDAEKSFEGTKEKNLNQKNSLTQLPKNILHLISYHIDDVKDFCNFNSACKKIYRPLNNILENLKVQVTKNDELNKLIFNKAVSKLMLAKENIGMIFVKIEKEIIPIDVNLISTTVDDVFKKISVDLEKRNYVVPKEQKIFIGGKMYYLSHNNDFTLASIDIKKEATIHFFEWSPCN